MRLRGIARQESAGEGSTSTPENGTGHLIPNLLIVNPNPRRFLVFHRDAATSRPKDCPSWDGVISAGHATSGYSLCAPLFE